MEAYSFDNNPKYDFVDFELKDRYTTNAYLNYYYELADQCNTNAYLKYNTNYKYLDYKNIPIENEISVHEMYRNINMNMDDLRDKLKQHDDKIIKQISKENKVLLTQLNKIAKENNYFRRELRKKNTPSVLRSRSFTIMLLAFFSLSLSKFISIDIVHPILSCFTFIIAATFYFMAQIMLKQDTKSHE